MSKIPDGVKITKVPEGERAKPSRRDLKADSEHPEHIRIGKPIPSHWKEQSWFLAAVSTGMEYAAREELEAANVPCFVLEKHTARRLGRRNKSRRLFTSPAFSGYVFVGDYHRALSMILDRQLLGLYMGIYGFVGTKRGPGIILSKVMRTVFLMHDQGILVDESVQESLKARIKKGDVVEVSDGLLHYMEGIVNKLKGDNSVEILMEMMGRKAPITVPLDSLRKIDP